MIFLKGKCMDNQVK